ncbi:MAG TPA: Replicase polyprotein 1ab [Asanoa sp.]|nr:Replicase polyprotein 1ab [Asanoa sp.]
MARHLVATGQLIDDDPDEALAHALAARRLASRIAAVREAVGLAAYHAGEWQVAIGELRTYHRMTGRQDHLAVLADCERALGRPERAIDLYRGADRADLGSADAVELLIVAAGARGDLGQKDAAVAMLQVRELTSGNEEPWAGRLRYAYADALLAADRRDEAREWFARAADADEDGETDAAERLLELDGVLIEGDDEDDEEETAEEGAEEGAENEAALEAELDEAEDDDEDDAEAGVELDAEGQADDDSAVDAEIDEDADDEDEDDDEAADAAEAVAEVDDDQPVEVVTATLPSEVAADDVPVETVADETADDVIEVDAEGHEDEEVPVDAEVDAEPGVDGLDDDDDRKVLPEVDDDKR